MRAGARTRARGRLAPRPGEDVKTLGVRAGETACGASSGRRVAHTVRWSEEQDDVLRECSFRGAAYARDEIERRCGTAHTLHAVELRASRIHCSLAVQTVCPECGAVGVVINRQTGLCRLCTERYHLEQERAFAEVLERERAEAEDPERIAEARRERDAQRQRNSRTCRRYGLKSRRARGRT